MIRRFILASTILIAAVSASPAMAATQSANLSVSSNVTNNCVISTSTLSFGAYDPIVANSTSDLNGTGSVAVTCTNGTNAIITVGEGSSADSGSTDAAPLRRLSNGDGGLLNYSIYSDAARTSAVGNTAGTGISLTGNGSVQTTTLYGKIASGQNGAPAGSYSDTVSVTVTY